MHSNKMGHCTSMLTTLQGLIQKYKKNEDLLLITLKCINQITAMEKPSSAGHAAFIELLFVFLSEQFENHEDLQVVVDIKLYCLRIISNF